MTKGCDRRVSTANARQDGNSRDYGNKQFRCAGLNHTSKIPFHSRLPRPLPPPFPWELLPTTPSPLGARPPVHGLPAGRWKASMQTLPSQVSGPGFSPRIPAESRPPSPTFGAGGRSGGSRVTVVSHPVAGRATKKSSRRARGARGAPSILDRPGAGGPGPAGGEAGA